MFKSNRRRLPRDVKPKLHFSLCHTDDTNARLVPPTGIPHVDVMRGDKQVIMSPTEISSMVLEKLKATASAGVCSSLFCTSTGAERVCLPSPEIRGGGAVPPLASTAAQRCRQT